MRNRELTRSRCPSHLTTLWWLATPLVVFALGAAPSSAQVVLDPDGLLLCDAHGDQLGPRAVPAADGASIVVWDDRRRGPSFRDIYALSVAADGSITPGWPTDGLALCVTGNTRPPIPVPDGAGGALVLFWDSRDGGQIHAHRVDANGAIHSGWPVDGKPITTGYPFVLAGGLLDAIPDGEGGAYFAWSSLTDFGSRSRGAVSRITADGDYVAGWNATGVQYGPFATNDFALAGELAIDPGAGVFFALEWSHWPPPETSYGATLARILAAGASQWSTDLPVHWSGHPLEGVGSVSVAPDGGGGCFSSWLDSSFSPTGYRYDEFTQHHSSAGAPQWAADTPSPTYQIVRSDGVGGVYLIGSTYEAPGVYVHRRLPDGQLPAGWTASGVTVSEPTAMGDFARISFQDDVFLCWAENTSGGGFDVRAAGIDSTGVVVLDEIVSGATGDQAVPGVSIMTPERALACWQDRRDGDWDIRATRMQVPTTGIALGPGPSPALALGAPWPNPALDRARVWLDLSDPGAASLEVVDVTGRAVTKHGRLQPGAARQRVEVDVRGLATGVYWLKLTQAGRSVARRFAVVR